MPPTRSGLPAEVIAVEHTLPSSSTYAHVEWMLGNTCTYACSYCPSRLHDGSVPWLDYDHVVELIATLDRHYRQLGKTIWLQYTGGEPTVYPRFLDLIGEAHRRGFRQSVISNGSRTLRFWDDAAPLLDYAILTYHIEFVRHDHFMTLVDRLRRQLSVHVNVTMLPERFETCHAAGQELVERFDDVSVSMKPLRHDFGDELYDYDDAQRNVLRAQFGPRNLGERTTPRTTMAKRFEDGHVVTQSALQFTVRGENAFRGWLCAAGIESLRISANGQIFRSVCRVGGKLGQVGRSLELPTDFVVCDRDRCSCLSDLQLTKIRSR